MPPRKTQNTLRGAGLGPIQRDPTPIVQTFTSFSQRRASMSDIGQSISARQVRPDPITPTRNPDNPDSNSRPTIRFDDELRSNLPDDEVDDPDNEDLDDEEDKIHLSPQDRVLAQLSVAINHLARSSRRTPTSDDSKVKVREPDTFDGSEPRKLRAFFVQCELNFQSKPSAFRSGRAKVNFAQSYLKGMALEWFEPDLLSDGYSDRPDWMDDYSEFMLELQTNFGPHDPSGDAEMQLEQLHMRDGQRINKYVVEFQRLASQVREWGDGALRRQFYNGLPARIKDEISRMGKPTTLSEFKTLAQTIDARYWERRGEVTRESRTTSSNPPRQSTSDRTNSNSSGSDTPKFNKPTYSTASSTPKVSDLPSVVGTDGKLTTQERQRRFDKKLCMFCGGPGHTARECTKSTSRAAKGRAAVLTPETEPEASDEAKN
jgi:Retrotransposon gag protein